MPRLDNREFFEEQIEKYGLNPEGVNWGTKESQYKRFEIIEELIPDMSDSSVLDLGCGFGDFYIYLQEKGNLPELYKGADAVPSMVEKAKERVLNAVLLDFLEDEIPSADYIVASGSLNVLTYPETREVIRKAFAASEKAFIFNIMSSHADFYEPGYNYFSPSEMVGFCMSFTRRVILRCDYMTHDFTIKMWKEEF
jgi:SAM-dependent methyltransferase